MRDRAVAWLQRRDTALTVAAVALIVVAGAVYSVRLGPQLAFPDEREHHQLAEVLAATGAFSYDGQTPTAYRPPAYPMFLSVLVRMGAGVPALRFVNFLLLAAAAALLGRLARRYAPAPAGALATAAVGLYPLAFYTAGTLYAQTFATALLAATLALASAAVHARDGARSRLALAGAGVVGGVLVLAVPVLGAVVGVLVVAMAVVLPRGRRVALVALVATAAIAPTVWVVRNAVVMGAPTLATNSGINLLLGNSEHTGPNSGVNVDISEHLARTSDMDEVEADAYYRHAAVDWVSSNPAQAGVLYLAKVANYVNFRNELYVEQEASTARDALAAITYYPLLFALAVRLLLAPRRPLRWPETTAVALYLSAGVVMALFFTRVRFRVPLDAVLCALVAAHLAVLMHRARPGGRGTVRAGAPGS